MDAGLGDRYLAADGAVTGIGEIDGRPVAVAAYDFTVMAGSMGAVGENKIARHARATRCASASRSCGCSTPPARASSRRAARRSRARRAVPRAGRDERRRADGRGDARALRGGHRVHPRARRLRADGEGHVVDGARRPPPREGRGRRRRDRGGDGRLGGAHQDLGCRRSRGRPTTRNASTSCAATCPSSRSTTCERPPVRECDRSGRPPRRGAVRHRADRAAARVRHAQGRDARSSTTATCCG